jgi:hypothetical protein
MKVTALIPDNLIAEIKTLTQGKNTTEAIIMAMRERVSAKRLRQLNEGVRKTPLEFDESFSATKVRSVNRRKR